MSKPITVPVVTSTGEVWFGGERAGRVQRVPDSRYWAANPDNTDELVKFNSKKKATEFLVERVEMGDLRPDHYRRFHTSKATRGLAPASREHTTVLEAREDPDYRETPPRAIFACRNVVVNGQPRLLVHHWQQGPSTYEGKPGFRPLPAGATVTPR